MCKHSHALLLMLCAQRYCTDSLFSSLLMYSKNWAKDRSSADSSSGAEAPVFSHTLTAACGAQQCKHVRS
eukprot:1904-Heterococcus_DN1.PRE.3